ncbi:TPA: glycosyltransferase [Pasteurella multocida]|nr:glycosyltransferase [Pasteurella multocida]
MEKKNVLIFTGLYLPGVKGGGPIRTIYNLTSRLKNDINFYIITLDRDLGDPSPYKNIATNTWTSDENGTKIYYINPNFKIRELIKVVNQIDYDVLYLNSFFNFRFTIIPLFLNKFHFFKKSKPIVLAPRGELSSSALSLKKCKKEIFTKLASWIGLYDQDIVWQGSSAHEINDIYTFLVKNNITYKKIIECRNLSTPSSLTTSKEGINNQSRLRICFLSRIAKIKNLYFALEILQKIDFPVFLGIYGPLEDKKYWNACLSLISKLPSHIEVKYYGIVENTKVQETISNYDLFFVPTQGENYGHVFIEALSSGTPILLSDQTPWRNLKDKGIGWDIPLARKDRFIHALQAFNHLNVEKRQIIKQKCINFADSIINSKEVLDANKNIFLDLV